MIFFRNVDVEQFVVHCHAGVSRSPAIAAALCRYLGDHATEEFIMNGKVFCPNPTVFNRIVNIAEKEKAKDPSFRKVEVWT